MRWAGVGEQNEGLGAGAGAADWGWRDVDVGARLGMGIAIGIGFVGQGFGRWLSLEPERRDCGWGSRKNPRGSPDFCEVGSGGPGIFEIRGGLGNGSGEVVLVPTKMRHGFLERNLYLKTRCKSVFKNPCRIFVGVYLQKFPGKLSDPQKERQGLNKIVGKNCRPPFGVS